MKTQSIKSCLIASGAVFLLTTLTADANRFRGLWKYSDDAMDLFPFVLANFGNLVGLLVILASGIWARGKAESVIIPSAIIAVIGGIWCPVTWFGWPMAEVTTSIYDDGGWFSPGKWDHVTTTEFSFIRLLGIGVFGVLGLIAWGAIALTSSKDKKA